MEEFYGVLLINHGGTFTYGSPSQYVNGVSITKLVDGDRLNAFEIADYVVSLGYEEVMIKNILFKSPLAYMDSLKSLVGDDSILALLRILKNKCEVHLYVDHEVNFAYVIDPVLSISWKDAVGNEGGGVAVDSNNNEGPLEVDKGNVTTERQGFHEDNFDNSHKEFDSEYESLSDEDLGSPVGIVDKKYLTHLHRARALRKKRRARSGVEEGLTSNTQAGSRETTPKSTQTRLDLTPSTPTRVKHVARKPTPTRARATLTSEQPSIGEATKATTSIEQRNVDAATELVLKERGKLRKIPLEQLFAEERAKYEKKLVVIKRYKTLKIEQNDADLFGRSISRDLLTSSQQLPVDNSKSFDESGERDSHYEDNNDPRNLWTSSSDVDEDEYHVCIDSEGDEPTNVYYNPSWEIPHFQVGMRFKNNVEFKEAIRKYSIMRRCDLKALKNEPNRQKYHRNKVRVVVDMPRTGGPLVFQGMYVFLKVLRDGWKNGCRPLIGVDGYFLKGVCKGVLLSTVGRDGNE
ncbi:hypothetical protein SLEP1_g26292 [Rubroshorea leprosula]|uniref:PB1-like domain-containing protein n=1 Tax=Rubroshorea leprosula TaxID=152421 RepID=A0AAV5JZ07_9ROSI|nr:hypothetical protein SLEP1_g26292 [Rubroshorea leprosula]